MLLFISTCYSKKLNPVMLYDTELIFDGAWNEAIYRGIKKFENKSKHKVKIVNAKSIENSNFLIKKLAEEGYNPIMVSNTEHIKQSLYDTIQKNPQTRFIIFNGFFDLPNAHYFSFSTQEATFIAGYLAMKKSKNKKISFIGGLDIAVINNYLCGYIKGAKYANKDGIVTYDYIANDFSAWTSPEKGFEIAQKQIENGSDVLFPAAGGSSLGVLKAASENNVFGIGIDNNQNALYPGSILTSVVVRVDTAVFRALMSAERNIWGEQVKVMGLQEHGVELSFDKYNEKLIPKDLKKELENMMSDIVLKKIHLPSYYKNFECKVNGNVLF